MDSDEPHKQNLRECIKRSDYVLNNDSTLESLQNAVDRILQESSVGK